MTSFRSSSAVLALSLLAAACSSDPAPAPADGPVSGVVGSTLVTARATVTAVDAATRRVTLQRGDGVSMTLVASEAVRNLPQVRVGDQVNVAYEESLAYEVRKPGEATPGATVAGVAGRAKEGEKPAGAVGGALVVTATIEAIDRETQRVTLRGPDGTRTVVRARDADKLARVAVGDLVEITYTEALAVSVTTPDTK